jgi:molybdopterin-guanine dinucleotide biosynthesis protein A
MSSRITSTGSVRAVRGAVLAGGMSSRMGEPKAGIELGGRPLIAYPIEVVAAAGLGPFVVAKPGSPVPPVDCEVIRDSDARIHPAAGIVAAIRASRRPILALACDMPFVPVALVSFLAELDAPVAVPRISGRLQPLLARYSPGIEPVLESAIERGEPLRDTVAALDPMVVEEERIAGFGDPDRIAFNVNGRGDLDRARRLLAVATIAMSRPSGSERVTRSPQG